MCNKGVPQGSVLGPLLFNVYVSDLEKLTKSGGASMPSFADDFTLYCAKTEVPGCAVSDALGNVADSLEMKGLSLSPEKTVAMFITHRSTTDIPAVTCNGTPIKTVTQARLLGEIVDDQLSWREHVNHLYRKIARCALPVITSANPNSSPPVFHFSNGACAHYVMVTKFQWKPFWLATQRDPQNDWAATQNRVNYDVFSQAPFNPSMPPQRLCQPCQLHRKTACLVCGGKQFVAVRVPPGNAQLVLC